MEKYVQADYNNPIHVLKIEKVFNRELEEKFRAAKASRPSQIWRSCESRLSSVFSWMRDDP